MFNCGVAEAAVPTPEAKLTLEKVPAWHVVWGFPRGQVGGQNLSGGLEREGGSLSVCAGVWLVQPQEGSGSELFLLGHASNCMLENHLQRPTPESSAGNKVPSCAWACLHLRNGPGRGKGPSPISGHTGNNPKFSAKSKFFPSLPVCVVFSNFNVVSGSMKFCCCMVRWKGR